jgi:integrase
MDDKYWDKELEDYWKSLEHDSTKFALYETYARLASVYYPKWLPERIDRDIWRKTVKETVLRVMMVQELEEHRELRLKSLSLGDYFDKPCCKCTCCHKCECVR